MKQFITWLVLAVALLTGASAATHAYLNDSPHRIAVVLDSSYPMTRVWDAAVSEATHIGGQRYTIYAAFSDKGIIHSWNSDGVKISRLRPYAPRNSDKLDEIAALPEIREAGKVIYITNDASQKIPRGWSIKLVQ